MGEAANDPLGEIGRLGESLFESAVNIHEQIRTSGIFEELGRIGSEALETSFLIGTAGAAEFDIETGQLRKGPASRAGDEALGEVTGRNQARAALNKSEARADKAEADALQRRADEQFRDEQQQRQASSAAGAARRGSRQPGGRTSSRTSARASGTTLKLGSERDFLGL